jgi:hypothetical protein
MSRRSGLSLSFELTDVFVLNVFNSFYLAETLPLLLHLVGFFFQEEHFIT